MAHFLVVTREIWASGRPWPWPLW